MWRRCGLFLPAAAVFVCLFVVVGVVDDAKHRLCVYGGGCAQSQKTTNMKTVQSTVFCVHVRKVDAPAIARGKNESDDHPVIINA